jgi:hypothetical protein
MAGRTSVFSVIRSPAPFGRRRFKTRRSTVSSLSWQDQSSVSAQQEQRGASCAASGAPEPLVTGRRRKAPLLPGLVGRRRLDREKPWLVGALRAPRSCEVREGRILSEDGLRYRLAPNSL